MTVETWGSRTGTGRATTPLKRLFIIVLVGAAIAAIAFAMLNRTTADDAVPAVVPATDTLPALMRHHEEANGAPLPPQVQGASADADSLGAALARHHEEANTPSSAGK